MTEPLEYEALYDLTLPSPFEAVTLSPDGDRAAFVVNEFDAEADEQRSSVFVVPTDGSREPHRLTRASEASSPRWSPDGSALAVLAAREEDLAHRVGRDEAAADSDEENGEAVTGNGSASTDDEPRTQVWVYDLERGGDPRQVTDFDEGVREFDWSPDGDRLVVSARDPTDEQTEYLERRREKSGPIETERLQHKADGVGWLDDVTTYLFVVDLTGETHRLDDAYGQGAREAWVGCQPTWGPEGIAFVSNRTDRPDDSNAMDVYVIDPDGGGLERVTEGDVMTFAIEWSPEGDRLAFVAWDPENFYRQGELYVADTEAGRYEAVSDGLDREVVSWGGLRWLDDETVVASIADEGLTRPAVFAADGSEPRRAFPAQGRDRELAGFDARGGVVAAVLSHPTDGPDVYAADETALFDTQELTRLSALNDEFVETNHTPRAERVTIERDGHTVEAIVYLPEAFDPDEPEPCPGILSIHGGPMSYDSPAFSFEIACWTSRGYLVVKPNYRGSTSYGQAFCETLRGRWGTVETDDQLAVAEALIDRGWIAPDRAFATGFSYGGISTAFLVTRTDLFAAAAPEHGIYDLRPSFATGDMHAWHGQEFGLPWEAGETYHEHSSITDVDEIETPLLLTAGGQDWRTPPTQAEQLYVSVRKRGIPARLVVYPDEHHNVGTPERRIHRLDELTSWFERFDPAVERSD